MYNCVSSLFAKNHKFPEVVWRIPATSPWTLATHSSPGKPGVAIWWMILGCWKTAYRQRKIREKWLENGRKW